MAPSDDPLRKIAKQRGRDCSELDSTKVKSIASKPWRGFVKAMERHSARTAKNSDASSSLYDSFQAVKDGSKDDDDCDINFDDVDDITDPAEQIECLLMIHLHRSQRQSVLASERRESLDVVQRLLAAIDKALRGSPQASNAVLADSAERMRSTNYGTMQERHHSSSSSALAIDNKAHEEDSFDLPIVPPAVATDGSSSTGSSPRLMDIADSDLDPLPLMADPPEPPSPPPVQRGQFDNASPSIDTLNNFQTDLAFAPAIDPTDPFAPIPVVPHQPHAQQMMQHANQQGMILQQHQQAYTPQQYNHAGHPSAQHVAAAPAPIHHRLFENLNVADVPDTFNVYFSPTNTSFLSKHYLHLLKCCMNEPTFLEDPSTFTRKIIGQVLQTGAQFFITANVSPEPLRWVECGLDQARFFIQKDLRLVTMYMTKRKEKQMMEKHGHERQLVFDQYAKATRALAQDEMGAIQQSQINQVLPNPPQHTPQVRSPQYQMQPAARPRSTPEASQHRQQAYPQQPFLRQPQQQQPPLPPPHLQQPQEEIEGPDRRDVIMYDNFLKRRDMNPGSRKFRGSIYTNARVYGESANYREEVKSLIRRWKGRFWSADSKTKVKHEAIYDWTEQMIRQAQAIQAGNDRDSEKNSTNNQKDTRQSVPPSNERPKPTNHTNNKQNSDGDRGAARASLVVSSDAERQNPNASKQPHTGTVRAPMSNEAPSTTLNRDSSKAPSTAQITTASSKVSNIAQSNGVGEIGVSASTNPVANVDKRRNGTIASAGTNIQRQQSRPINGQNESSKAGTSQVSKKRAHSSASTSETSNKAGSKSGASTNDSEPPEKRHRAEGSREKLPGKSASQRKETGNSSSSAAQQSTTAPAIPVALSTPIPVPTPIPANAPTITPAITTVQPAATGRAPVRKDATLPNSGSSNLTVAAKAKESSNGAASHTIKTRQPIPPPEPMVVLKPVPKNELQKAFFPSDPRSSPYSGALEARLSCMLEYVDHKFPTGFFAGIGNRLAIWEPYWYLSRPLVGNCTGQVKKISLSTQPSFSKSESHFKTPVSLDSKASPKTATSFMLRVGKEKIKQITEARKQQKGRSLQDGDCRILLRMMPIEPAPSSGKKAKRADGHLWPIGTFIAVNSSAIRLVQRKQQSHDDKLWKSVSQPFDMTDEVLTFAQSNTARDTEVAIPIDICCYDPNMYVVDIGLYHYRSPESLFRATLKLSRLAGTPEEITRSQLYYVAQTSLEDSISEAMKLVQKQNISIIDSDDEGDTTPANEEVGKFIFTLTCPFSKSIMKTPVRGQSCKHWQCFDLMNYLSSNSMVSGGRWRCSSCEQFLSYKDLKVCSLTKAALAKFKDDASPARDRVEFRGDRSYHLLQENKRRYKPKKEAVQDQPQEIMIID